MSSSIRHNQERSTRLSPGEFFLKFIKIHNVPIDCSRWTEDGMRYFLSEAGFDLKNIITNSWGNKKCAKLDLRDDPTWTRIGFFRSMKNNKMFPMQIWALAKKN